MAQADEQFSIRIEPLDATGSVRVVRLEGELDVRGGSLLLQHLPRLPVTGEVHVDLSGVSFLDSSGLVRLLRFRRAVLQRPQRIRLCASSRPVQTVLAILGLMGLVETA